MTFLEMLNILKVPILIPFGSLLIGALVAGISEENEC